jgi:3-phenylpropionate/trans-cinnamate dioxygenase ferredoxin reductase component
MTDRHMVLVGGGLAAATAAETFREQGFDGPVTIIGRERETPYLCPPLSKGFLLGTEDEDAVHIHDRAWYADNGIDLQSGSEVVRIDRRGRVLGLSDGRFLAYDRLLLATGARPRRLRIPGEQMPGVSTLRTLQDSRHLREEFTSGAPRVVVIGSSWLGMEVAAAARQLGAEVTVIGRGAVPLSGAMGPVVGNVFQRRHEAEGVDFRMHEQVAGIIGDHGAVNRVLLESGQTVPADLVILAVGSAPESALAAEAGLDVAAAIRVDPALRTSDPQIWAAGDVATVHLGPGRVQHSQHWANAIATGRTAALSMLDRPVAFDETPYFYTDQYDLGLEFWGDSSRLRTSQLMVRGELDAGTFVAFWVEPLTSTTGVVVAGMHINVWDAADEIKELVAAGGPVDLSSLSAQKAA